MTTTYHDIFDYRTVQEHIENENLAYFQARFLLYCQQDLSHLFYHCCRHNCSPRFIDGIVGLGTQNGFHINLNYGCVKGALFNRHYTLLEHIVTHYGKSHQVNFFDINDTEIPIHLASLVQQRETHNLLTLILQPLPQHTQTLKKVDKPYFLSVYLSQQYSHIYSTILGVALAHRGKASEQRATGYYQPELVTDKTLCIDDGIAIIARKKFPVLPALAEKIRFFALEYLFEKRLNHVPQEESSGMAQNLLLQKERLDMYDSMDKKLVLLKELATEIHVPTQMIDIIEMRMLENGDTQTSQIQRVLDANERYGLDSDGFDFMQAIGHRPHLFRFFNTYFNYERAALHHKLDEALKIMNKDKKNSYEASDVIKI